MKHFILSLGVVVSFLWANAQAETTPEKTKVKVGLAFRYAEASQDGYVNSFMQGFDFAKKEFSKQHPDFDIEFVKYEYKWDPKSIRTMAQKLVKDDVKFVIGGESTDEAKPMAEIFEQNKVLLMTPTSSEPGLTVGKKYIFRACFTDDHVAKALARYVFDGIKARKAPVHLGIVHNMRNSYTNFLTRTFYEEMVRLNGELPKENKISFEKKNYTADNLDFMDTVKSYAAAKVDTVVLFVGKFDFLHFVESAQKQKFFPTYIGSDGWGSTQNVVESLGKLNLLKDFTGVMNSYWHDTSDRPEVKNFIADYKTKYAHLPDAWTAIAYDSAMVLFQAIHQASGKSLTIATDEVANALKAKEFTGLVTSPKFKYESNNSPKKSLYLYEVSASRADYKTTLE